MDSYFDESPESGTEGGRSPTGVPDSDSRNPAPPPGEPSREVSGGAPVGGPRDRFESPPRLPEPAQVVFSQERLPGSPPGDGAV